MIQTVSREAFDTICGQGQVVEHEAGEPSVILHPDNTITKVWSRRRRWLSSNTFFPYSGRFVRNAARLAARGVAVPKVLEYQRVANSHLRLVRYESLPGNSIRQLLRDEPAQVDIADLARYVLSLHSRGILFRSLHFGNIIRLPKGDYGLIDFTDVRYFRAAAEGASRIPLSRRALNIVTPLRYRDDVRLLEQLAMPSLVEAYLDQAGLASHERAKFEAIASDWLATHRATRD